MEQHEEQYDIAIVGAGPGGYSTALRAAQLGRRVALIERDATLGGTCLNRGCIPSKALITATHAIDTVHRVSELGVNASVDGIDFGRLHDYRLHIIDTMTKGLAGLLAHRGVTVYRGEVVGLSSVSGNGSRDDSGDGPRHALTVNASPAAAGGQVERYVNAGVGEPVGATVSVTARDVVLATGSRPRPLPGVPFHAAVIDSTHALEINEFPASAVIIGSGAVALEFASMWSSAGSDVTLLIRKDRVLSGWDRRAGVTLTRELKRHGVTIITHSHVTGIDTGANLGATVRYTRDGEDGEKTVWGQIALAAIGRDPITDTAWMRDSGVTLDRAGMVVTDELCRTNLPGVWAVGDITEGPALAHRAFEQGIVVAEAIAGLDPTPVDDATVPQVVFCAPEAASVGFTLDQAQSRDDLESVGETVYPMLGNARMLMSGSAGSMSIVSGAYASDPDVPVVLGVHIVSPLASDLIAEAEQLVGNRVPLHDAARLIHPHPTFAETLGEALLKADGRPLHTR
ncbi:FAD-dependent oxidoreductase [Bifidobacterium amazonense]|uniref:FAD-dependent oxidoreductase n=1 Tax=Bifidobacterium amazonense TaxID=2809027 RepID=A0ABS9VUP3_9BIFI|nr:FAD-dependent oxidoreductase [Bifidobacterium amazonense]MCH9275819.1 FAD-dependent oxidoreductase [Bifidobacterium amazonense]